MFDRGTYPYGKAVPFIRGHTLGAEKDKNFIECDIIKVPTKKIHEAGGCNLQDDYIRGLATNITVEDFCNYLLESVPVDAVFYVGGVLHFYLHVDSRNQAGL